MTANKFDSIASIVNYLREPLPSRRNGHRRGHVNKGQNEKTHEERQTGRIEFAVDGIG